MDAVHSVLHRTRRLFMWAVLGEHDDSARATSAPAIVATLLDAPSVDAVCALVRRLSAAPPAATDTDALLDRIRRRYMRFPPVEPAMRRLSLWQQTLQGTHGMSEFCVVTVYAVCTDVLAQCARPQRSRSRPLRARSAPPRTQNALSMALHERHPSAARRRSLTPT